MATATAVPPHTPLLTDHLRARFDSKAPDVGMLPDCPATVWNSDFDDVVAERGAGELPVCPLEISGKDFSGQAVDLSLSLSVLRAATGVPTDTASPRDDVCAFACVRLHSTHARTLTHEAHARIHTERTRAKAKGRHARTHGHKYFARLHYTHTHTHTHTHTSRDHVQATQTETQRTWP